MRILASDLAIGGNPADAALLVQPAIQNRIAALLFNAINLYFSRMDPAFEGYSAPVR